MTRSLYSTSYDSDATLHERYPIFLSEGHEEAHDFMNFNMVPLQFGEDDETSSSSENDDPFSEDDLERKPMTVRPVGPIFTTHLVPMLHPKAVSIDMSPISFDNAIENLGLTKECLDAFATFPVQEHLVLRCHHFKNKLLEISCSGGVTVGFLLSRIHQLLHTEFAGEKSFSIDFDVTPSPVPVLADRRKSRSRALKSIIPQGKKIRLLECLGPNTRFVGIVGDVYFPGQLVILFQ